MNQNNTAICRDIRKTKKKVFAKKNISLRDLVERVPPLNHEI
jgi:hypothetical protein